MNLKFTEPAGSVRKRRFLQTGSLIRFCMRVSLFYMILVSCSIQLLRADDISGQGLDTKVTIGMQDESLGDLFRKLKEKTGLSFVYPNDEVDAYSNINLSEEKRSVKEVLELVLEGKPLAYSFKENTVFVYVDKTVKDTSDRTGNAMASISVDSEALFYTVTGTVMDAVKQEPMAGVNIIVKGTATGTTTDIEGKYSINANDNDILAFTFIGFKTYETQVNGRVVIDVLLEEDIKSLQEVEVNAGYWQVRQRENTGNIATVSASEIEKQPINSPLQALQGRMPGVYVQQLTGVPGGAYDIKIRGQNSLRNTFFNNGNLPLYIINGVPYTSAPVSTLGGGFQTPGGGIIGVGNPLNALNPSDIESIEILKDADATAIYGSRGANGVVLITTKKGKVNEPTVDINFYQGVGRVSNMMELLNTKQYLEMRKEAFINDARSPSSSDYDVNGTWDTTRYTNWQKELIGKTAQITSAQASVGGGNEAVQFLIGTGYYKETSVYPDDFHYDKVSTNFSINHASKNDKVNITLSGNFVIEKNNQPVLDPTSRALSLPPVTPAIYNEQGDLNWENRTWSNPLASFRQTYSSRTTNLISNAVISYKILDGLKAKVSLGYNETRLNANERNPIASFSPSGTVTGDASFTDTNINSWIIEPQLGYEKSIGSGRLNLIVGATYQENMSDSRRIDASGYNDDALLDNIQSAPTVLIGLFNNLQYRYRSIFGRVNYNWKEKYIVNLTGRRDGSSRFGPSKQNADFGAIGVAWIFSNESFIRNGLTFLSFGKFRGSYGITGSDQIGDYGYLELWNTTAPYNGIPSIYPSNLFNSDFQWEINKKLEVALELGFGEDRVTLSTSYYRNKSSNQLVGIPLPATTGFSNIQSNFSAEVENTGVEIELNSWNFRSRSFSWSTRLNVTIPKNKLVSFPDIENTAFAYEYRVGKPLGIQFRYQYDAVDSETGLYMIKDVNENGVINLLEDGAFREVISQEYFGGLQNSIKFKGVELSFLFQFVKQSGRNYLSYTAFGNPPGSFNNQPNAVLDRWKQPGDITDIQRFTTTGAARTAYRNTRSSDASIDDASFVRLKNVSVSYQFPTQIVRRMRLENLKLYFQGQNLVTFTNYDGLDPETQSQSLPPLRVLTMGVQLTF